MIVTILLIVSPFLFRQAYIQYNRMKNIYSVILTMYIHLIWFKELLKRNNEKSVDCCSDDWVLLNPQDGKCKTE